VLELLYGAFLLGNHDFHDITDSNYSVQLPVIHDGKVTNAVVRHQAHAFGTHGNDLRAHDVFDRRFFGRLAQQYDFAGVVSLREESHQLVFFEDEHRAHPLFGHQPQGVEHLRFRRN